MADKPTEKITDLINLDQITADQAVLQKKTIELEASQAAFKKELDKFSAHLITPEEVHERFDRYSDDIKQVQLEVEAMKNAVKLESEKFVYNDYRSMLLGAKYDWLQHETGQPLTDIEMRAYALFQMPIDYNRVAHGQEIKNLRDFHDALITINAVKLHQNQNSGRYKMETLKLWPIFVDQIKQFDPTLAHAMAGGNTGYGAEWVPTEFSAEFNALLRITPSVAAQFQVWNMPPSGSGYYPFQNGAAKVYRGTEATTDNPTVARATQFATSSHLFSPNLFIGRLLCSAELTEDTLLDMNSTIRNELAVATIEGLDSAIINGDSTVTHQDNYSTDYFYKTYDVETYFKGLRRIAVDDTNTVNIETLAGDTGVGALKPINFSELQGMIGIAGTRPDQCRWFTGIKGRNAIISALLQFGAMPQVWEFFVSGTVPNLLGSPLITSGVYLEQQDTDGLGGAGLDHTSICYAHTPSFRIGQRRGVTLEFAKDIDTQQLKFVSTLRADFGKISAAAVLPVSCGINVQHT